MEAHSAVTVGAGGYLSLLSFFFLEQGGKGESKAKPSYKQQKSEPTDNSREREMPVSLFHPPIDSDCVGHQE